MNRFEASATVEEQGRVLVAGVPFARGTKVDVTITPSPDGGLSRTGEPGRAQRLLAALDKARNSESVGPLRRAELQDRDLPLICAGATFGRRKRKRITSSVPLS